MSLLRLGALFPTALPLAIEPDGLSALLVAPIAPRLPLALPPHRVELALAPAGVLLLALPPARVLLLALTPAGVLLGLPAHGVILLALALRLLRGELALLVSHRLAPFPRHSATM
jgi:hypothetical protein